MMDFLRNQGYSDEIYWLWREAVITRRTQGSRASANRRIFIDMNQLATTEEIRRYYEYGAERGLGIGFNVLCVAEGRPCAFVYLPDDALTADQLMMTGLKCAVPTPCPTATAIRATWLAALLRWALRPSAVSWRIQSIPRRPAPLARGRSPQQR